MKYKTVDLKEVERRLLVVRGGSVGRRGGQSISGLETGLGGAGSPGRCCPGGGYRGLRELSMSES